MEISEMIGLKRKKKTTTPENASAIKTCEVCVAVDYPQQGEKITAPCYTFRVGAAGDPERVEISIDQGPWQPCRHFFWAGSIKPFPVKLNPLQLLCNECRGLFC